MLLVLALNTSQSGRSRAWGLPRGGKVLVKRQLIKAISEAFSRASNSEAYGFIIIYTRSCTVTLHRYPFSS